MPDERGRCRVVDPSTSQAWSSASPVIVAPLTAWSQRALQMSTPIRDLHRVPHQGQTEQSSEMRSHPSTAPGNSSFRGVRSTPVRKASFGRRKCGLPACLPWGSFGEPPLLAFVGKSVLGVSPGEGGGFLLVRPSGDPTVPDCGPTISPFRRRLRRLATTSHFTVPRSTFPHSAKPPPRLRLPLRLIDGLSVGRSSRSQKSGVFTKSPSLPPPPPLPIQNPVSFTEEEMIRNVRNHFEFRVADSAVHFHFSSTSVRHSTSKHFHFFTVVPSDAAASSSWAGRVRRPFPHSLELVSVVSIVVVVEEERRLVAEEGTLIRSGDDPWEKKRMPVAPAAVSSVWAGRGGHWFAVAVGGGSLTAAIVSTSITGKENIDRFKLDKQGFCK